MWPCLVAMSQTGSPLATITASHRASQDLPTLGEPARICRPWESRLSTTKFGGRRGRLMRDAPSTVWSFVIVRFIFCCLLILNTEKAPTIVSTFSERICPST